MKKTAIVASILAAVLTSECKKENAPPSSKYSDNSMWLCKPGLTHDYCFDDLSATEIKTDGSRVIELFTPSTQTDFDCFYIYPTVDIFGPIGNHTDFSDVTPMLLPLMNQAARFSQICTVYAPLYSQITLFTFQSPDAEKYEEIAYEDVAEAFRYYMEQYNKGRPFVLLGHSQGSIMLRMLLQREFDGNPDIRSRLIAALLIGGDVLVPAGKTVGETFTSIPVCTAEDQVECVIAYQSYAKDYPPPPYGRFTGSIPDGTDMACTNPANMSGSQVTPAAFDASYFPTSYNFGGISGTFFTDISTPFFLYRQFYAGRCATDTTGSYLEISYPAFTGDTRTNQIPFDKVDPGTLINISFGLHILDYNFPMGDLIKIVRVKAQAMQQRMSAVP